MTTNARWYVVHTHAREEFRALDHLRRQNYVAYLPRYAKKIRHARRTTLVARPFFPRYLFISLDLAVQGWRAVRSTCGVSDIVCFGDQPAALPDGFVEYLKSREDASGCISLAQHYRPRTGERVLVRKGPFSRLLGYCETVSDNERVTVLLDLLGRKVRVLLDVEMVEAA
jgi:transcriptional antiterminator RfaH